MVWIEEDFKDHLVPKPSPKAGMPLPRPGGPKPHPLSCQGHTNVSQKNTLPLPGRLLIEIQ